MHYTKETQQSAIREYRQGKSVTEIARGIGASRSTVYNWIEKDGCAIQEKEVNLKLIRELQMRSERLKTMIEILKTVPFSAVNAPLREKLPTIENMAGEYSVNVLCEALNVPKGTYYNYLNRGKHGNTVFAQRKTEMTPIIEGIYNESNHTYGPGKIAAVLRDRGFHITERYVADIMHTNGWFSLRSNAKRLFLANAGQKENLVKQQFTVEAPNRVWVSDVTTFKHQKKAYYICVILDLFSRRVLAFRISTKNSTQLTKGTFTKAWEERKPAAGLVFHSDRGSNYVSGAFVTCLRNLGVVQSFSRSGTPYDNAVCESFFSSMKREELYLTKYRSENEFRKAVADYIEKYNTRRPHTTLQYKTPQQVEAEFQGEARK